MCSFSSHKKKFLSLCTFREVTHLHFTGNSLYNIDYHKEIEFKIYMWIFVELEIIKSLQWFMVPISCEWQLSLFCAPSTPSGSGWTIAWLCCRWWWAAVWWAWLTLLPVLLRACCRTVPPLWEYIPEDMTTPTLKDFLSNSLVQKGSNKVLIILTSSHILVF